MKDDLGFVKLDGFRRDIQQRGDFLDGASLGNELQHFPLARRQFLPLRKQAACPAERVVTRSFVSREVTKYCPFKTESMACSSSLAADRLSR
jgi:hypothetical protein